VTTTLTHGGSVQSALAPLMKRVMEVALQGEMDNYLDEIPTQNYRNGTSKKRIKSSSGSFELEIPRDRNCEFEPQIIKKRQTVMTEYFDSKILNLYANGMSYADIRDNLEEIYRASSKDLAEDKLLKLDDKWSKKYPIVVNSWNNNWEELSSYFKYDRHIRKLIYTTNAVEGLHRMVRKYTKSKGSFTSKNALLKLVFCAHKKALKKWTQPIHNWAMIVSQLEIHFPERLSLDIK